jgi:hypothetical protein
LLDQPLIKRLINGPLVTGAGAGADGSGHFRHDFSVIFDTILETPLEIVSPQEPDPPLQSLLANGQIKYLVLITCEFCFTGRLAL